ncbi:MAG TPA: hypothetical protein EYP04_01130 [Anaerolineae bacterium]|nr:hypothetical protein [Anaerolineae bacterium]HIQ05711.1 hypothetical protein [Anaerolineae bacterium]
MSHDADVIVVGAGPAGSTTAYLLARHGWRLDQTCARKLLPQVRRSKRACESKTSCGRTDALLASRDTAKENGCGSMLLLWSSPLALQCGSYTSWEL